ncbi:hypothetical protein BKA70DRAFT_1302281 [Coprinopsis sp. MPI-PUGE-AT-0042]|nr:hypothetical protein BKA70DRAFT_1302281 [Coprinopsis sp. MPI-PUGE-AT-0042]
MLMMMSVVMAITLAIMSATQMLRVDNHSCWSRIWIGVVRSRYRVIGIICSRISPTGYHHGLCDTTNCPRLNHGGGWPP